MKRILRRQAGAIALTLVALAAPPSAVAADYPHPATMSAASSSACLECHDGVLASNVLSQMNGTPMPPVPPGGTHPVNLDYLTAQTSGQAKLRPVSLLPPEIRLVNGRVECVSCHDLSASGAPRLVMGMHRSRLCFACHAL